MFHISFRINWQKFLQGALIGILILSLSSWFSLDAKKKTEKGSIFTEARAGYPWNCVQDGINHGFSFENTFASNKRVRCIEYLNCVCPGVPSGKCIENENIVWENIYGPGESGFCTFSGEPDDCLIHQVDIKVANIDLDNWADVPNCWYIFDKCWECVTPTPTPAEPTSTPTPTPTEPTTTPTSTPTPVLGCYDECNSDEDCAGEFRCQEVSGTKRCVNIDCPDESDCTCNRGCWDVCGHDSECPSGLSCRQIDETKRCVHPDCEREKDCDCGPEPTPTAPRVLGAEAPEVLPKAGAPLILFSLASAAVIILRFLVLAL